MKLSLFNHKADNVPRLVERTWERICRRFARPEIRPEKDGQLLSPALFEGIRSNENVRELSGIVLDLDHDVPTLEEVCNKARRMGCAFGVYSTHSHLRVTDNNPKGERRYRIIWPLKSSIAPAGYPALRRSVIDKTGLSADPAACALAQMFYTPSKAAADAAYEYHVEEGEFLDWTTLELSPIEKRSAVRLTAKPGDSKNVDELLRKAFAAKNGAATFRLFEGDTSAFGGDESRADMSLANRLSFFAGDVSTLEEMLCRSRLNRPKKWNEKHYGDNRTYLEGLIDKAFEGRTEFYSGNNGNGYHPATEDESDYSRAAEWPELDPAALYGPAGDLVRVIEPHTESDPAAILFQVLVAFGNVVGRTAYFTAESTRHYFNLFVLLIGVSAKGRKGTSWNHVFRFFRRVAEVWATNCISSCPSSGEALIWIIHDPIEKQEPIKEKGKVIGYQMVQTDPGVVDKRMLVFMPEFASMLRVMTRDGNTVSTVFRQLWDSDEVIRVNNKNSPIKATGPHLSSVSHITKDEYLRNVDETDKVNGFANRILHVLSRRSKCLPEGGSLRDSDFNDLVLRFHAALEFAVEIREMKRNGEARELWREVYPKLSEGGKGIVGAVTSRAEAQVMRIACVYALLDQSSVVRVVHLRAALALWKYCEDSARFVFGDSVGDRLADDVLAALREVADLGLTRTQIRDLFRRNVDADRIGNALRCLSENGLAHSKKEPSEGRPIERWFATPQSALKTSLVPALSIPKQLPDEIEERLAIQEEGERYEPVFTDPERKREWDSWEMPQ